MLPTKMELLTKGTRGIASDDAGVVAFERESASHEWSGTVARYKRSSLLKSGWQVTNSLLPFLGLWYLMYLAAGQYWWLTLLLALPTAGFLVRIFIIQHDCGHHSFFRSRRANDVLGFLCGVLTLTPYHFWRRTHARHHVTSGNLDHRGHGDVGTLTVDEYLERSHFGRLRYRIYRHPLFLFFVGASCMFIVQQRFTRGVPRSWRRERISVYATIGVPTFLLIELPIVALAAAAGSWLFFVQHQYEDAYWHPHRSWDFTRSALEGSSYYRLPRVLRWFTGNIGYHHIHHLNSRIPNYNLAACYTAEPALRQAATFGLFESLKCASLKLWDEDRRRMVTFAEAAVRQLS